MLFLILWRGTAFSEEFLFFFFCLFWRNFLKKKVKNNIIAPIFCFLRSLPLQDKPLLQHKSKFIRSPERPLLVDLFQFKVNSSLFRSRNLQQTWFFHTSLLDTRNNIPRKWAQIHEIMIDSLLLSSLWRVDPLGSGGPFRACGCRFAVGCPDVPLVPLSAGCFSGPRGALAADSSGPMQVSPCVGYSSHQPYVTAEHLERGYCESGTKVFILLHFN